jgi:fumarylacetoacetase
MNDTHDPLRESWVESANDPSTDFPIQNLPYGIFTNPGDETPRVGIAIGDQILDVAACFDAGYLEDSHGIGNRFGSRLNSLMSVDRAVLDLFRADVSTFLARGCPARSNVLVSMKEATMLMPVDIGDYSDFYASIHHATNVGSMFRPDNPLLPNYKYLPIGYHGRASSIVVSGAPVTRPSGQTKAAEPHEPVFGPSQMLDYESELGFFVGSGNSIGGTIPIDEADSHIFGFCLVNDWSARDIQSWEYQPLGPFLAKNFATTISPWVVTSTALEPFRVPAMQRPDGDPIPLEYLRSHEDQANGGLDITMEVYLSSQRMRDGGHPPLLLSRAPFSRMYWTVAQMLTHHASNGCNMRRGDLIASGTVSGPDGEQRGCLLELTWRGTKPLELPTGEPRRFLEDGDEVIMRAYCETSGHRRIGFGECRGTILSSPIDRKKPHRQRD